MTAIDSEWAIRTLQQSAHMTGQVAQHNRPGTGIAMLGTRQPSADSEAGKLAHVAEQSLDRVLSKWRRADDRPNEVWHAASWNHLRGCAMRSIAALPREKELGENAPHISAGHLHPWVWSGARSLLQSGHYRSAVEDAAWALAKGMYAGIRNPFNHENPKDIDEQTDPEQLATLRGLARWVEDTEVDTAP